MAKLKRGQFIMIREGTAARNLEALAPLAHADKYVERCMFCTDDKHPSDLLEKGHIDYICREGHHHYGVDPIIAVKAACHHAARYFLLNNRGAIAPGLPRPTSSSSTTSATSTSRWSIKRGQAACNDGKLQRVRRARRSTRTSYERAHDTFHVADADGRGLRATSVRAA